MKLRPYQEDAITALESWFATESIEKHPLLSLPTASGKTVIFSNFIKRTIKKYSDARFLVLAHRQELIEQAEEKIKDELKKEILTKTIFFTEHRIKKEIKKTHNSKFIEESLKKLSKNIS